MKRLKSENRKHIKELFSVKAGVALPTPRPRIKTAALLASVILCFAVLAGFSRDLVSGLDGDELGFSSTYLGQGIVEIRVENRSEKDITFQPKLKLMRWEGSQEVPASGKVRFSDRTIPAGTTGTMTLDLSSAYNIEELEKPQVGYSYYFILTNNEFLFGQDWMCSVQFGEYIPVQTEPVELISAAEADPALMKNVPPELIPFFQEATTNLSTMRERREAYYAACAEILAAFDGRVVPSACPALAIDGMNPEPLFDTNVPADKQHWLSGLLWERTDGYGIPVGASDEEYALVVYAFAPTREGDYDGGAGIPVAYYMAYAVSEIGSQEDCAFIHGQLVPFRELEESTVYEDETYICFDVTDYFYADLRTHTDNILEGQRYYMDEGIQQRIENITAFYRNRDAIEKRFYYNIPSED